MFVPDERRLIGRRPVGGPLLQMWMDVAQIEEALLVVVLLLGLLVGMRRRLRRAVQQIPRPAHGAHELQLVIDGVKRGQAVDLVVDVGGNDGRRRLRGVLVMRPVVRDALRAQIRVGLVVPAATVPLAFVARDGLALDRRWSRRALARSVAVDEVLLSHSPRSSDVPGARAAKNEKQSA